MDLLVAITTKFRTLRNGELSGHRRQWVHDALGIRRQICSPSFKGPDEEAVQKKLDKWAVHGWSKAVAEQFPSKSAATQTVGEYLISWLPTANWSKETRRVNSSTFRNHIEDSVIWNLPLRTLGLEHILLLIEAIDGSNGVKRTVLKLVNTAFQRASRLKLMDLNPVRLLEKKEKPKVPRSKKMAISEQDEALLVHYLAYCTVFWRAAILLGLDAGFGPAELGGLRVSDVTMEKGYTFVNMERNLTRSHEFGPPKADARERKLRVDDETAHALREHMATFTGEETHVFQHDGGPTMNHWKFYHEFVSIIKAAGIKKAYSFYALRHTMATRNLNSGEMGLAAVSQRLGHSSITTTLKHYYKAIQGEGDIGAQMMGKRMTKIRAVKIIKFPEPTAALSQAVGE